MADSEKTPLLASQDNGSSAQYSIGDVSNVLGGRGYTENGNQASENNCKVTVARSQSTSGVDPSLQIALSWHGVNVSVDIPGKKAGCCGGGEVVPPETKEILRDVTGIAKPGSLLAIMGASGAGKSTLLNVLTQRNIKGYNVTGDIRLNGWNMGEGIRHVSAYVQQDDLFIGTLTVREQLQFRALLRMDRRLDKRARLGRVEDVITEMGLTKCADTRIGAAGGTNKGISGGERKRLSFASEALTNPPIFFCDEPTSGLDTFMAQNIVQTLQKMASRGRAILCTIHQPSSELYSMFNQILLLAEGRTAFLGEPNAAMEFFEKMQSPCPRNFNPADHYILTLAIVPGKEEECRERTRAICDAFSDSEGAAQITEEVRDLEERARTIRHDPILDEASAGESRYASSWFTQFRYLFWRSWINTFRDVILFRVRIMQTFTVAVILGLVYLQLDISQKGVQDINGAIFLLITNTSFSNMFAVVNSFPLELGIFIREYGTGLYRVDTYYLTKTFSEMPLFIVISVIFTAVTYWMMGLHETLNAFLVATAVLLLTANIAVSLGYLISTACGSVTIALAVAPPLLIPFMLFGGLFVNNDNIPVYFIWLEYLSWFKFSNEVLVINQWQDIDYIPCPNQTVPTNATAIPPFGPRCAFRSGDDVINYLSFDKDNVWRDIGIMFALMVGFRILSFLVLVLRAKRSKG
ncbi:protein white [Aplysia californica]|uniref:Protein white n=1 Tax=Aplysia californica TaxID=6500 RepID=A0ABM0JID8_APLCA|nr:protein white [Aplysia californica]XP_005094341.1 protein white [Aplysia californica]